MIPHNIYRLWFDAKPYPDIYKWTLNSFRFHNRNIDIKTLGELQLPDMRNRDLFESSVFNVRKADLARIEVIYFHGGIYADVDVLCLRPLDFLDTLDAFTGVGSNGEIGNAFFGARARDPWVSAMIDYYRDHIGDPVPHNLDAFLKGSLCGFHAVTKDFPHVKIFDSKAFYPVPPEGRSRVFDYDMSDSYTVHLWHGSSTWIPEFINYQNRR